MLLQAEETTSVSRSANGTKPVIAVEHLHKAYGPTVAVQDVSFTVNAGEIFGILGRNGAGKTTTVECVTGLRRPDRGAISVLGLDPRHERRELHERVGVQLQQSALQDRIRVAEAVELYASFYRRPADGRELLATLGLERARDQYFAKLSGGQKQRLSIVLALIEGVRDRGVTIVLVSHYMEEAERLCDRVAVIDHGNVIALDKPAALGDRARTSQRVRLTVPEGFDDRLLQRSPRSAPSNATAGMWW